MPNFHPMLVHFPIALIFIVVACDLIGHITGKKPYIKAANIITGFAALGAIASVLTGVAAEESVWLPGSAHDLFELHELLGFTFLGIVVVLAIIRLAVGEKIYGSMGRVALLIAIIGAAVVGWGGYLGGEMVYTHGAGVKQAEISTARADSLYNELKIIDEEEFEDEGSEDNQDNDAHKH